MIVDPQLLESTKLHEGLRLKAYQDSLGVWTIGYGRNLQELEISREQAEAWLIQDLLQASVQVRRFKGYSSASDARKNVLIEMCYNLGPGRLSGFKKMWEAIEEGDYNKAAAEMLDSKWAKQVGNRAIRLANIMRAG